MKRRALATVVSAAFLDAEAVYLNPDGLGQALIYPYYTAQSVNGNALNTYISVMNTTPRAKVLRVRFREGRRGAEVANFNLYLSPNDMWTGAVVPNTNGANLITADVSCVNPRITGGADGFQLLPFSNASYTGTNSDGMGTGLDRTREGYLEMIEMGTLTGTAAFAVTHTAGGPPANCAAVQGDPVAILSVEAPTGGLAGTVTLINVALGMNFTVNAEALADLATQPFYRNYSDPYPDFDAAEVTPTSHINANGKQYRLQWNRGVDAVSSVFMRSTVINEFMVDPATQSATDWVMTYPTRRFYVSPASSSTPFLGGGICEIETATGFSREEANRPLQTDFPESPPLSEFRSCWASTVSPMRTVSDGTPSLVFGSANGARESASIAPYANGWVSITFLVRDTVPPVMPSGVLASLSTSSVRDLGTDQVTIAVFKLYGLPVTGFMARTLKNGTLNCGDATCQGNYGGAFPHKYRRDIRAVP